MRSADASKSIRRSGDAYGRLADREISRFQYEKVQSSVDKGLSVAPSIPRLLALKKELARPRRLIIIEDIGDKVKGLFDRCMEKWPPFLRCLCASGGLGASLFSSCAPTSGAGRWGSIPFWRCSFLFHLGFGTKGSERDHLTALGAV
jgi:hypothetical protein